MIFDWLSMSEGGAWRGRKRQGAQTVKQEVSSWPASSSGPALLTVCTGSCTPPGGGGTTDGSWNIEINVMVIHHKQ